MNKIKCIHFISMSVKQCKNLKGLDGVSHQFSRLFYEVKWNSKSRGDESYTKFQFIMNGLPQVEYHFITVTMKCLLLESSICNP